MGWESKGQSSWYPAREDPACGPWERRLPVNPDSLCCVLHAEWPNRSLRDLLGLCSSAEQQTRGGMHPEASPEAGPRRHGCVSTSSLTIPLQDWKSEARAPSTLTPPSLRIGTCATWSHLLVGLQLGRDRGG